MKNKSNTSDNPEEQSYKKIQQIINDSLMLKEQQEAINKFTQSVNDMTCELNSIKKILRDGVYKN